MKLKRLPRMLATYLLTGVLTVGVIIAFGILSASGMMLLTPSLVLIAGAFMFGGVVEGEVFKHEILEGLQDFALLGNDGYQYLMMNALHLHLKTNKVHAGFLHEYQQLRDYLESLRGKELTAKHKEDKRQAKKRLQLMQRFFTRQVMEDWLYPEDPYQQDEGLIAAIQAMRAQLPAMRMKMYLFRLALPFSLLCGAGFGFATASALPAALAMISASLGFLVWPLAVVAAIGYTFLVFHTIKDILYSDRFRKWKESVKNWFTPGPEGVTAKFVAKAIVLSLGVVATVALCVMGTLATAGTWWLAVKHGAKLIPYLKNAARIIRMVLTPIAAFGNFVFSLFNSFESIHVIMKAVRNSRPITYFKNQWQQLRERENWAQILNPFRFLCRLTQRCADTVFLLGHVLASGTARDQFLNIPPSLLAITSAGSELTQDVTFFFEEGKKTLIQRAVTVLLSPLLFLSAGWQYLTSQCNAPQNKVTFSDALRQSFEVTIKPPAPDVNPPVRSNAWRTVEINHYLEKEKQRLFDASTDKTLAADKISVLNNWQQRLKSEDREHQSLQQDEAEVLNRHRLFTNTTPTRSALFAEKMTRKFVNDDPVIVEHSNLVAL